jgi:hypothetical protein
MAIGDHSGRLFRRLYWPRSLRPNLCNELPNYIAGGKTAESEDRKGYGALPTISLHTMAVDVHQRGGRLFGHAVDERNDRHYPGLPNSSPIGLFWIYTVPVLASQPLPRPRADAPMLKAAVSSASVDYR